MILVLRTYICSILQVNILCSTPLPVILLTVYEPNSRVLSCLLVSCTCSWTGRLGSLRYANRGGESC